MNGSICSIDDEERQEVIEAALMQPLPDAVFNIYLYNNVRSLIGPVPHCDPISFEILTPCFSDDEVETWLERSAKLRAEASKVAGALIRCDRTFEEARTIFVANNPGFNAASYDVAISCGCIEAW